MFYFLEIYKLRMIVQKYAKKNHQKPRKNLVF